MFKIFLAAALLSSFSSAASASLNFDFAVYQELEPRKTGNVVFSPFSLNSALGLIYLGTRGQTRSEIAKATGFDGDNAAYLKNDSTKLAAMTNSKEVTLLSANGIWYAPGTNLEPDYLANVKSARAVLQETNFRADPEATRRKINDWGSENTKGMIPEAVPMGIINAQTNFILANAVYFYGPWKNEFKKELTKKKIFNGRSKKSDQDFMNREGEYRYTESADFQAIDLPYKDPQFVMTVVLFRPGRESKLSELITPEKLQSWSPKSSTKVNLKLPKFEIESEFDLVAPLKASGIKMLFTPAGDFTGAIRKDQRSLSERFYTVRQKAIVKVDEKGTEAAAVTVAGRLVASVPPPPPQFVADRPFLFFIRNIQTDTVLFIGQVIDL